MKFITPKNKFNDFRSQHTDKKMIADTTIEKHKNEHDDDYFVNRFFISN